jgi:hypothetical protein
LAKSNFFTKKSVIRIQRATARKHGGKIPKESFVAKVQSIFDKQQPNDTRIT